MKRFSKIKMGIAVGIISAMMLTTSVSAKSKDFEMPTIEDTVDFSPGFDQLEPYQAEYRVQDALVSYGEASIYKKNQYTYDNQALNNCVNYSIPLEIYMFNLKTMSDNGLGEFKIGGKTFDDGIWWVEWYDDSETCVADCDQSEYKEVISNLNKTKWKKTDDNTYKTKRDKNGGYYELKYYSDLNIIEVTKYIRKGHGPEFKDLM